MANVNKFRNPETGETKKLKSGWSWTCFFFYFTGIPLFIRGLTLHGIAMLMLWLSMFVADQWLVFEDCSVDPCFKTFGGDLVALLMLFPMIYYARKANQMGAKKLQFDGWVAITEEPT